MKPRIFATVTACSRRSLSTTSSPGAMLLAIVSEKIKPSCMTEPVLLRHTCGFRFLREVSPILTSPLLGL